MSNPLRARAPEFTPRKVIEAEEWERKLKDVKIRKEDMNKLVMSFFVAEELVEVAEKFQAESGTDPEVDLAVTKKRMEIREAVEAGDVVGAIDEIKALNPEILDANPRLYFRLQQQYLLELIRAGQLESAGQLENAIEFAQEELAPRAIADESFLQEVERTIALLVFGDVNNCEYKELLGVSHRSRTATEVNAAILASQGQEKDPKLPNLLKTLRWAQDRLDEKAIYPRINSLLDSST